VALFSILGPLGWVISQANFLILLVGGDGLSRQLNLLKKL
jgi:hypothetical protein